MTSYRVFMKRMPIFTLILQTPPLRIPEGMLALPLASQNCEVRADN